MPGLKGLMPRDHELIMQIITTHKNIDSDESATTSITGGMRKASERGHE